MKTCKSCGQEKPPNGFTRGRAVCKPCRSEEQKKLYADPEYRARARANAKRYYAENKDKAKAYRKKWRAKNRDLLRLKNAAYHYGISVEEVRRLLSEQENVCAICGGNNGTQGICIDHCHESGEIRGLLCHRCNLGLGYFDHDASRLVVAARYLN